MLVGLTHSVQICPLGAKDSDVVNMAALGGLRHQRVSTRSRIAANQRLGVPIDAGCLAFARAADAECQIRPEPLHCACSQWPREPARPGRSRRP
jgi:hypothetical protein